MSIKVGTIRYNRGKKIRPLVPDGYEVVEVMTRSCKKWYELSPYYLSDEKGHIMENIWQFSKVYPKVPRSRQTYSRYNPQVIWDHPAEVHIEDGKINNKYIAFRSKYII